MFDLSIVLPTCNRAPLLQKAIDSIVANATLCYLQVIVVDGAHARSRTSTGAWNQIQAEAWRTIDGHPRRETRRFRP